MKKNINGYRLNKNGNPILNELGYKRFLSDMGASFKEDGDYYFFVRKQNGWFIYSK